MCITNKNINSSSWQKTKRKNELNDLVDSVRMYHNKKTANTNCAYKHNRHTILSTHLSIRFHIIIDWRIDLQPPPNSAQWAAAHLTASADDSNRGCPECVCKSLHDSDPADWRIRDASDPRSFRFWQPLTRRLDKLVIVSVKKSIRSIEDKKMSVFIDLCSTLSSSRNATPKQMPSL